MQIGMVGLGRMGGNIAKRLARAGHSPVVYDRNPEAVRALAGEGCSGASDLADLATKLTPPRAVWLMLPAGAPTEETVAALGDVLASGRRDPRRRQFLLPRRHPPRRARSARRASISSMSGPRAACGASSAAIA